MSAVNWILFLTVLTSQGMVATKPGFSYEDGRKGVVVSGKVYLGEKTSFSRAVTIDQKKIFESIPAYQSIKKEGVEKDTARYHFLIQEANRVFKEALKKLAKEQGFDLVVEKDGIKIPNETVSDVTQAVIDAID